MDIPDSVSDMDSVPETVSLSRSAGTQAAEVRIITTVENFADSLSQYAASVNTLEVALNNFNEIVEIAELECLYGQEPE